VYAGQSGSQSHLNQTIGPRHQATLPAQPLNQGPPRPRTGIPILRPVTGGMEGKRGRGGGLRDGHLSGLRLFCAILVSVSGELSAVAPPLVPGALGCQGMLNFRRSGSPRHARGVSLSRLGSERAHGKASDGLITPKSIFPRLFSVPVFTIYDLAEETDTDRNHGEHHAYVLLNLQLDNHLDLPDALSSSPCRATTGPG
jgi:hypothetical protein